jgi:transposase
MEVLYPHCAGLDVHKDMVVACLRHTVDGTIKREVRTFKTTTAALLDLSEWLASEGCTDIVMEATGVYWKPVWHILGDGDFALTLANAAHVKAVPGRKTDVNDATWLADLLAHGLVRGSFVPDAQTQEMRGLLRTRKQLVRERTSHVQRLQKTLEDAKHQARFGDLRCRGAVRPGDDRGADRRRDRPPMHWPRSPTTASGRRRHSFAKRCAAG